MPTSPSSFAALGVPADVVAALTARGIHAPFPIQSRVVADGLAGRDLCAGAPTGSGKTIAFGIPLVARVGRARPGRPHGLVLVPTRELATQVTGELTWLGAGRRLRVAACFGGVGYGGQRAALRRGVDVLVACPGRLEDLCRQGDVDLDEVQVVVLDEADRMTDMGFLPQVRRLLARTPATRQTFLFSATLDGAVDGVVRDHLHDPAVHRVEPPAGHGSRVEHRFVRVTDGDRAVVCAGLVRDAGPTIVFCRTRRRADRVARDLGTAGLRVAAIHGDRSQRQREQALDAFATGRIGALVATDVAARGIHVDGIACVVHFDPPADPKDYVHRSGRTARAGATGTVVSLVGPDQLRDVEKLQRALRLPVGVDRRAPDPEPAPDTTGTEAAPARRARRHGGSGDERGTVSWFDAGRGFGFITRPGRPDLFVHVSEIDGDGDRLLRRGQAVRYVVGAGRRGDEARGVCAV